LRTSLAFAVQGIVIAQLFRLTQSPDAVGAIGYYAFGIPLACVSIGCAILVAFAGAHRFWRQQNAMSRGKVYAGGWELGLVSAIGLLVSWNRSLVAAAMVDCRAGQCADIHRRPCSQS
jgi:uncharacterized membrane protein YidH (DUF202 family)